MCVCVCGQRQGKEGIRGTSVCWVTLNPDRATMQYDSIDLAEGNVATAAVAAAAASQFMCVCVCSRARQPAVWPRHDYKTNPRTLRTSTSTYYENKTVTIATKKMPHQQQEAKGSKQCSNVHPVSIPPSLPIDIDDDDDGRVLLIFTIFIRHLIWQPNSSRSHLYCGGGDRRRRTGHFMQLLRSILTSVLLLLLPTASFRLDSARLDSDIGRSQNEPAACCGRQWWSSFISISCDILYS